jgi:uncharacterized protein YlxW (UPF0749 family)
MFHRPSAIHCDGLSKEVTVQVLSTESRRWLAPAAVCLLLGLLLAVQMKTQAKVRAEVRESRVAEEKVAQFLQVSAERDRLLAELRRLQQLASEHATQVQIQEEVLLGLASAGLVEVKGPGVRVSLADPMVSPASTSQVDPDDVMRVLNELRAGGAEALSVNGVRVTPQLVLTRTRERVGRIAVNGNPVVGAVEIKAIGDPQLLVASLAMRGGVVEQLSPWVDVRVVESYSLVLPAMESPPAYRYALPVR